MSEESKIDGGSKCLGGTRTALCAESSAPHNANGTTTAPSPLHPPGSEPIGRLKVESIDARNSEFTPSVEFVCASIRSHVENNENIRLSRKISQPQPAL